MNLESVHFTNSVQFDNRSAFNYINAEKEKVVLTLNAALRTIEITNLAGATISVPLENVRQLKHGSVHESSSRGTSTKAATKTKVIDAL